MSKETEPEIPKELFGELDAQYEALEAEHAPDVYSTLGILAVQADLARTVIEVHAEPWRDREVPDADKFITEDLQETRDRLTDIGREDLWLIASRSILATMPQFLFDNLGVDYQHQVFERLAEKTPDGSPAVSDEVMLNFLQWHNYQMIEERERFLEMKWPYLRENFVSSLRSAVKQGWIPADALNPKRLEALENAEIIIDDGVRLHEAEAVAYVVANDAGTAPEVHLPRYTFQKTANHELSHVMAGRRLPKGKEKGRFSGELNTTGLYRLFDKEHRNAGKVIDEAVTEHIALSLGKINQDLRAIKPDNTPRGLLSTYHSERELLDVLCNGGAKPVDIKLFITAYFEDSSLLRQSALRTLKRNLVEAFPGRNVINELGALMSTGDYDEASEGLSEFSQSLRFNKYKNYARSAN